MSERMTAERLVELTTASVECGIWSGESVRGILAALRAEREAYNTLLAAASDTALFDADMSGDRAREALRAIIDSKRSKV